MIWGHDPPRTHEKITGKTDPFRAFCCGIYPVEGIGVFRVPKWRCSKQKTTCFAGGDKALYKKITFPLQ